jgi:hypothetical protein
MLFSALQIARQFPCNGIVCGRNSGGLCTISSYYAAINFYLFIYRITNFLIIHIEDVSCKMFRGVDGGRLFLQNTGKIPPDYTISHDNI